ncbi:hypothetical protein D3C87_2115630 [compost metagenome]
MLQRHSIGDGNLHEFAARVWDGVDDPGYGCRHQVVLQGLASEGLGKAGVTGRRRM